MASVWHLYGNLPYAGPAGAALTMMGESGDGLDGACEHAPYGLELSGALTGLTPAGAEPILPTVLPKVPLWAFPPP